MRPVASKQTTAEYRGGLLAVAALVCTLAAFAAAAQGNLGFLADAPAGSFDSTDWTLLKKTVRDVLTDASEKAARSWRNDANGHGGDVRTLKVYHDEAGRECKQIRINSSAGGRKGSSQYAACRDANGTWRGEGGTPLS
jgi:surface antigen